VETYIILNFGFFTLFRPPLGLQMRGLTVSPGQTNTINSTSRHKNNPKALMYVLATLASVTRVRWRPPANESFPLESEDRHEAMLAVATQPVKGASAGGAGLLALWSYHRPFMPLSVVQGHRDGAIVAFDWLETPATTDTISAPHYARHKSSPPRLGKSYSKRRGGHHSNLSDPSADQQQRSGISGSNRMHSSAGIANDGDAIVNDNSEAGDTDKPIGIWQHVISVGRDGRCLIQSFVRGEQQAQWICLHANSVSYLTVRPSLADRRSANFKSFSILLLHGEPFSISKRLWLSADFFCLSTGAFRP